MNETLHRKLGVTVTTYQLIKDFFHPIYLATFRIIFLKMILLIPSTMGLQSPLPSLKLTVRA